MIDTKLVVASITLDCEFAIIACGICKQPSELYVGHSISEFVAMLEADGWTRAKEHGWICFGHDTNTNKE